MFLFPRNQTPWSVDTLTTSSRVIRQNIVSSKRACSSLKLGAGRSHLINTALSGSLTEGYTSLSTGAVPWREDVQATTHSRCQDIAATQLTGNAPCRTCLRSYFIYSISQTKIHYESYFRLSYGYSLLEFNQHHFDR